MKKVVWGVFLVCVIGLISINAYASGFALFEQSARGLARGGAFAAQADDPSALWYNPAGITQLEGTQVMSGTIVYYGTGDVSFDGRGSKSMDSELNVTPNLFYTAQISDRLWAGAALFTPFGMSSSYDENWDGRYNSYYSGNVCVELNPNLVYKVNDDLSVGFGVSLQTFEVELKQKINTEAAFIQGAVATGTDPVTAQAMADGMGLNAAADIDQSLIGKNSNGFRYNAALHWKMNEKIAMGLSYRSETKHDISGDADYKNVHPVLAAGIFNADVSGEMTLPQILWAGVAFQVNPKLTIETDINWTGWSSHDSLDMTITNGLGALSVEKDWDDVFCYRAGLEYKTTEALSLRVGYLFDESPVPDSTIEYAMPFGDRHVLSSGLGYTWGKWTFDGAYSVAGSAKKRRIEARPEDGIIFAGSTKSSMIHNMSIAATYRF